MFRRARLRLTAYYFAIVLLLVVLFSASVAGVLLYDLANESKIAAEEGLEFPTAEASQDIRLTIITLAIVDPVFVLLSLVAGWLLAGRTLAPIQKSLNQQQRFVSDAAHELRTPLAIMKAGLETIEAGPVELEDYRQLNRDLHEEIERVIELSNDLLFLSRTDQQAQPAADRVADLSAASARNMNLLRAYAASKSVRLSEEIKPGIHCLCDESDINRLLLNLLKNAIDYNREGGEVSLRLGMRGRKIELKIADTGIGIGEEDLKHVFERFYKADESRARSGSGTGLGLAIVEAIVRAHGGEIEIESSPGRGTQVTVILNPALKSGHPEG